MDEGTGTIVRNRINSNSTCTGSSTDLCGTFGAGAAAPKWSPLGSPSLFPQNCAANCDCSTTVPILNVNDYTCFGNLYSAGCT
ncbi:MAG: hypothetical protein ACKVW3_09920 [Phycisphaerales bacterium]